MPATTLKARALQCIAQREHSRVELRRKLLAFARRHAAAAARAADAPGAPDGEAATDPGPEVDALLDWLAQRDLLSPARFVETRVHARMARFGNRRITQELAQHGVNPDEQTVQHLQRTELARARAVWLRRYGQVAADPVARLRQMRFLAARGFSPEVVRRVVGGAGEGEWEGQDFPPE